MKTREIIVNATKGTKLEIHADGPDAEFLFEKISDLLSDGAGI